MPKDSSIYGSFNFYGQPGIGRRGATPSMTSLAGSQQVSSTMWQPLGLTPTHSVQTLTAKQSSKIFSLAAECQALGMNLAKQFQTISGLEGYTRPPPKQQLMRPSTWGRWPTMWLSAPQLGLMLMLPCWRRAGGRSAPKLTRPGRAPMSLCTTTNCITMDNLWPSLGMLREPFRKNGVRSGNVSTSLQMWKVPHMTLASNWPSRFSTNYPSFP